MMAPRNNWANLLFLLFFIIIIACNPTSKEGDNCLPLIVYEEINEENISLYALLLPFHFENDTKTYHFQFDLGADASIVYESSIKNLPVYSKALTGNPYKKVIIEGKTEEYFWKDTLYIYPDNSDEEFSDNNNDIIGSVGLDFLIKNKILTIDFKANRICIGEKEYKGAYDTLYINNNKLFTTIKLNNIHLEDFFFDTGFGAGDIFTTKSVWENLTGKTGGESDNIVIEVPSFGKNVKLVGSYMNEADSLRIGGRYFQNLSVFYLDSDNEELNLDLWGFKASGIIGTSILIKDKSKIHLNLENQTIRIIK